MPKLYILCGPSASGKSTWAKKFILEHKNTQYVSRDNIRFSMLEENEEYFSHEKEVFDQFTGTIIQALMDKFDVIADATHLNKFSRKKLTNAIDKYFTNYEIKYVVFYAKFVDCCIRDDNREGIRHVGENIIQGMFRSFKAPLLGEDERATEIIEVGDGKDDFSFTIIPYRKEKHE